jgi:hypothetical protein
VCGAVTSGVAEVEVMVAMDGGGAGESWGYSSEEEAGLGTSDVTSLECSGEHGCYVPRSA